MSRLDWKRGRFNADNETDRMFQGLRGWRDVNGDWLNYYRYNASATTSNIYGESTGQGRVYLSPVRVPCIHVTYMPGANDNAEYGFYTNADLDAIIAFDLFTQMGMTLADIETQLYLKDRVLYERNVYRITQIAVRGKIQERPTIVGITATQCKPDELVDDAQFAQWSA